MKAKNLSYIRAIKEESKTIKINNKVLKRSFCNIR